MRRRVSANEPRAGADHLHAPAGLRPEQLQAACYLEALENATAEELVVAKRAHLFVQQARRELPERKPAAAAVRVRVQKRADRRERSDRSIHDRGASDDLPAPRKDNPPPPPSSCSRVLQP